jgi:glycogen debranching enzyme
MGGGWGLGGTAPGSGDGGVTLVEGSSFCVSDSDGTIRSGSPHGVFYMDTRVVSAWRLVVDGRDLDHLATFTRQPHHATFLAKARPSSRGLDSTLLVQRDRYVGAGMREDVVVTNLGAEAVAVRVDLYVDADFADLFAVKEGRTRSESAPEVHAGDDVLELELATVDPRRGLRVRAAEAAAHPDRLTFRQVIPARGDWRTSVEALPMIDGAETAPDYPVGQPLSAASPSLRLEEWTAHAPELSDVDDELHETWSRTQRDLGSLRIVDPSHPECPAVAAGAPWFMALFGRDSLLTAYMALPVDQDLALGTLHTLGRYQGSRLNARTEEQPGRILHEMRFGVEAALALGGGDTVYYGTADATPLFVLLLGEVWRWGIPDSELEQLLPHADRALDWVTTCGDADGDGLVEYERLTDRGLRNQGWKDSWDGINFADGRIAEPPIALCEVQAYVYAALLDRAAIARHRGDLELADTLTRRAGDLKATFNERFWLPDKGWFAVGLDRDKTPVDALTSNIGHCLWTGIVDEDKAPRVAEALVSEEMFSGWGVRTLSTAMAAYNPLSYHNGSVWPHDNAIVAAGLMRYGFVSEAQTVAQAILEAAECFDGRLPELFTGIERGQFPRPVPYPTSCSPQAWAAAAPLLLLRTLLRFDPDLPRGEVRVAPVLPRTLPRLRISRLPLAGARLTVAADGHRVSIHGLPAGIRVVGPTDATR